MSKNSSSVHFKSLHLDEKVNKLTRAAALGIDILIWKKGSEKKYKAAAKRFSQGACELGVEARLPAEYIGSSDLLYTFDMNGLNFFGKGSLNLKEKNRLVVDCSDDLFKSEKRASFRLLTYPHHQVTALIKVSEEELKEGNVIGFKSRMSETGIFKNFLNLLDGKDDTTGGFIKFIVQDISVTGMAIRFGEFERKFFKEEIKEIGKIVLDFNGDKIELPKNEIRYIKKCLGSNNISYYKVGMKFLEMNTNVDDFLGRKINEALRDIETEFEDFLS